MALNCRPEQAAWICVPVNPGTAALGMIRLHGHVVVTKRLLSDPEPTWAVEPNLTTTTTRAIGGEPAGTKLLVRGIPDAWLRPFKDFPPQELQVDERELTT